MIKQNHLIGATLIALAIIVYQWICIIQLLRARNEAGKYLGVTEIKLATPIYDNENAMYRFSVFNDNRVIFNGSSVYIAPSLNGVIIISNNNCLEGSDSGDNRSDARKRLRDFVDDELVKISTE